MVGTGWVDAMFVRDHFPELARTETDVEIYMTRIRQKKLYLGTNLIATLASLNMDDFTHVFFEKSEVKSKR